MFLNRRGRPDHDLLAKNHEGLLAKNSMDSSNDEAMGNR